MSTPIALKDIAMGDKLTFNLYGNSDISSVDNAKVVATSISYELLTSPVVAATRHSAIFADIPNNENLQNDYRSYPYLVVELDDGSRYEIGIPWVITESLLIIPAETLLITIKGKGVFTETDKGAILEALKAYGYSDISMQVVTNT